MISEYCFLSFCLPSTIFFFASCFHEILIFNLLTGVHHLTEQILLCSIQKWLTLYGEML